MYRRGEDRKAISLCAGLHFRQRHLRAPQAPEKWGGEKRTLETLRYQPRVAAATGLDRSEHPRGGPAPAPAPHPLGLRELGAGMRPAAGPSRTGRWRHRGGDKGARPYVSTRAGGAGGEALGNAGGPGEEALGARERAGRGVTCAVVVAPGGWRVVTTGSAPRLARAHLWGWGGGRR